MNALRATLENLGWPKQLTDRQIAEELLRRWFNSGAKAPLVMSDAAVVARGVYTSLAREGNLDALCWTTSAPALDAPGAVLTIDPVINAQQIKHELADHDYATVNRRKSGRVPRSDLLDLALDYGEKRFYGWLVDVSDEGAAIVMESGSVPSIGQHIETIIHERTGGSEHLGHGLVVRTEMLSTALGLVCIELDQPRETLAA